MKSSSIEISILIEKIVECLRSIEDEKGGTVEFNDSLYWNIPYGHEFNLSVEPTLDIGDLFDDIEIVKCRSLDGTPGLNYFIEILRAIVGNDYKDCD